ncbi:hypothetical protein CRV01_10705 [Arcobacter sp. CECT 8983]|uniref:hypothetical protein n=1 Tax=Arcobacter sp. CECT 8983 TaxID=2044508 RepID=UPI00100AA5CF|nr:hypothetical protein [Arcobacter sp. CECT 8983]RXJ89080.1 hypothetical protein CRV01_10705 [Arcobacter sp. CECT 8983]
MINSVSSVSDVSMSGYGVNDVISRLTSDEYSTVRSVLSNYDSSNLSNQDAVEITQAFDEANIEPSRQLNNFMDSLGFDAQQIGQLASVLPQNIQASNPSNSLDEFKKEEEALTIALKDLLLENNDNNETPSFSKEQVEDFASKIAALKDDTKESVKQMIENLSSQSSSLTQTQTQNIVQNSLSQVLSDSNNYNSFSIYA